MVITRAPARMNSACRSRTSSGSSSRTRPDHSGVGGVLERRTSSWPIPPSVRTMFGIGASCLAFRARREVRRRCMPVCVFAPAPILTVTIERGTSDAGELHIHPGGMGFWVARMLKHLGATAILVTPLGGETGDVFGHLVSGHDLEVRAIPVGEASGAYVHDRREG